MSDKEFLQEVAEHELSPSENNQAGGLWTVPGTHTIGRVCTISWECNGFICGW
ncbi:MAG: hypothetical protein Q4D79_05515 [Propionibacteriaceae bacterium]|nr:hypothetical protein [Propionibacteriaceae bacterium]